MKNKNKKFIRTSKIDPKLARSFDRYSENNAMIVEMSLDCGCEPYVDGLTLPRWNALGMKVTKGSKAIKLETVKRVPILEKDGSPKLDDAGNARYRGVKKVTNVFCKHMVEKTPEKEGVK